MSQLKTYDIEELRLAELPPSISRPAHPGDVVCHVDFRDSTFGTVVAIDEDQAAVLWSRGPMIVDVGQAFVTGGYVFAPYVPLQATPTIFDPTAFTTGSIARYSKRPVNRGFFVTGSIR